jgi:catechol-2,3-dioxygenase
VTTRRMIIDHVNIHVRNLAEARQLYRAAKDGDR